MKEIRQVLNSPCVLNSIVDCTLKTLKAFQQDNAPCHVCQSFQNFFRRLKSSLAIKIKPWEDNNSTVTFLRRLNLTNETTFPCFEDYHLTIFEELLCKILQCSCILSASKSQKSPLVRHQLPSQQLHVWVEK